MSAAVVLQAEPIVKRLHAAFNHDVSRQELLTKAADGQLRVKLHVSDAEEARRARNRTVSLVSSLVATVGVAFLVRHLAPALGPDVERIGAVLLLILGGWLLVAAARL